MGTEYELFKPEKKERYDLGKGMWSCVFPYNKGESFKLTVIYGADFALYCKLLEKIAFDFNLETKLLYFSQLAKDIYRWCSDDVIHFHDSESFNDLYWSPKYKTYADHEKIYPITGSRFWGEGHIANT